MQAIVNRQKEFFIEGEETGLKPMILKDVAEVVGMDVSTISRVANSKYVETDHGIFPLKFFFSEGVSNDSGEEVSNREIKKILESAIGEENKKKPFEVLVVWEIPFLKRVRREMKTKRHMHDSVLFFSS